MKKKLFGVVLCVLLFIGTVTLAASANGVIKSVTINGLSEPLPGEPMDFDVTPAMSNLYDVMYNGYCIYWIDEETGIEYSPDYRTSFVEGHSYRVKIYVDPASGYSFAEPSQMTAFIDNRQVNVYKDTNGYFLQYYFDPCGTINFVDLYYDWPAAGEAPSFDKIVDDRYFSEGNVTPEVNGVSWYDVTTGKYLVKGTGAKFLSHHTYKVSFTLRTTNCEFGNATAKVNGKNAVLSWYNPYLVGVEYTFDAVSECTPTAVSATEATCTKEGNIAYYECTCGEWYKDAAGSEKITDKNSVVVPATGHSYSSAVTAPTCTEDGYTTYTCACGDTYTADKVNASGHTEAIIAAVDATCTKTGLTQGKKCSVCGVVTEVQKAVAKKAHTNKTTTTKATLKKNGKQETKCTVCGTVSKTTTIYSVKSVKLSKSTYTCNGKVKTPSVVVKDSKGKTLKKNTDYTVKYASGRKNPGKYTVTVTFKGKYSGTKKLTLTIKPAAPTLTKASSGKKGVAALSWKNVSGESGYQLYYATSKNGTFKKVDTTKKDVVKVSVSNLKSGKTYYFKVRAYKKTDSGTVYSSWSSVKSIKVK